MSLLRILLLPLRLTGLLLLTLGCGLTLTFILPVKRLAPRWQLRWRNQVFRTWARGCARLVRMRIQTTGNPPQGNFLLVANHLGYVDIFLLAAHLDAAFVAKADLRNWPALGPIFASADTIFIDRSRKKDVVRVTQLIASNLARDLGVVLFPEGTSGSGDTILPLKPPLLEFAIGQAHAVHYAAIAYRTPQGEPPAREVVCWWGKSNFVWHLLRLLRLPYFDASLHFGPEPMLAADRKALAETLRSAMLDLLTSERTSDLRIN